MAKGNTTSNYPAAQASRTDPAIVSDMMAWLEHLRKGEKPRDNAELKERINWYFEQCQEYGRKPSVETLCLCIHMSRQAAWKARQQGGERAQILNDAWQTLAAVTEALLTDGLINPISAIFLLKSQFSYKDTVTVEQATAADTLESVLPDKADIMKRLPLSDDADIDREPEIEIEGL